MQQLVTVVISLLTITAMTMIDPAMAFFDDNDGDWAFDDDNDDDDDGAIDDDCDSDGNDDDGAIDDDSDDHDDDDDDDDGAIADDCDNDGEHDDDDGGGMTLAFCLCCYLCRYITLHPCRS